MLDLLIAFIAGIGCTIYANRNKEELYECVNELKQELKNAKKMENDHDEGKKRAD